ncbi:MAG: Crp/Fnr family transcriptional regulator [Clostridiales bacterium]|nr:Crp/Fnr family transcriptional regulator [Clostridiales bacterium]
MKNGISDNGFGIDDSMTPKPAFRIFSRSVGASGWSGFFASKPTVTYPKGAAIVAQGDENANIFYIARGLVEYTHADENGSETVLEILGPGNMLNLQPVFGHNPSFATFAALSECIISSADKNEVLALIEQDNELAFEMLEEMAFIIGGLNRRLPMGTERADIRTMRMILMIATIHRHVYHEEGPIYIRLSQSDLARVLQTTRVTISKILSDLKKKDVIKTDYGGIYITDMDLLTMFVKKGGSSR